jgi:hypothetical protein
MTTLSKARAAGQWLSMSAGVAAAAYATYAGVTWLRYGHASSPAPENQDPLLDRFMPAYDIAERHHVRVAAPADITFMAACETDLQESPIARVIFRAQSHPWQRHRCCGTSHRAARVDEVARLGCARRSAVP